MIVILQVLTLSIKLPIVFEESNVRGEAPLSNSITVPAAIAVVIGLLRDTVVKPPVVTTPLMFVFAGMPATLATTS